METFLVIVGSVVVGVVIYAVQCSKKFIALRTLAQSKGVIVTVCSNGTVRVCQFSPDTDDLTYSVGLGWTM